MTINHHYYDYLDLLRKRICTINPGWKIFIIVVWRLSTHYYADLLVCRHMFYKEAVRFSNHSWTFSLTPTPADRYRFQKWRNAHVSGFPLLRKLTYPEEQHVLNKMAGPRLYTSLPKVVHHITLYCLIMCNVRVIFTTLTSCPFHTSTASDKLKYRIPHHCLSNTLHQQTAAIYHFTSKPNRELIFKLLDQTDKGSCMLKNSLKRSLTDAYMYISSLRVKIYGICIPHKSWGCNVSCLRAAWADQDRAWFNNHINQNLAFHRWKAIISSLFETGLHDLYQNTQSAVQF